MIGTNLTLAYRKGFIAFALDFFLTPKVKKGDRRIVFAYKNG